jgi:penicillin-binding protein 1A
MASSAKYANSQYNLAADGKRQPGSSFKVMALATAVSQGINPASASYASAPLTLPDGTTITCYGGHCSGGSKNLIAGTLSSDNGVYIRLALDLGPKKVAETAHKLGITSELQGYPSETLGGLQRCCSPLEMANAYATIVDGGWRNKPKAITKVQFPDGTADDLSKPQRTKVFEAAAMYEIVKILEMNISRPGTGGRARTGCPVGGKTGTTDQNSDAWFVGFSPRLATSVWVGFPQGRIPMGPLFHGANVDGGTFPAQIWGQYMKAAARGYCGKFAKPKQAFKTKSFKGKYNGERPAAPSQSADELAAAAQRAKEQVERNNGKIKPGPAGTPGSTGGNGYDPGAYDNSVPPAPPPPPPPPAAADPGDGTGEPQATPTPNGGATPP